MLSIAGFFRNYNVSVRGDCDAVSSDAAMERFVGGYALAVELKHGPNILMSVLKSFPVTFTLSEVCESLRPPANMAILKAEASENKTGPWLQVEVAECVRICSNSLLYGIWFFGWVRKRIAVEEERPLANAFNILMQASKEVNVVFNLLCLFCFHKAFYERIKK